MFWLLVNAFTVNVAIIESGSPAGVTMVVNQKGASEWEEHADTGARLDCGDRCIIAGLGCHLQGHTNRGQWSPDRVGASHKLPRTVSRTTETVEWLGSSSVAIPGTTVGPGRQLGEWLSLPY